jgi:MerR family copper efflux transcriptional regulator
MSYRIGEVAKLTGLSAKTIRFYEQIGLIPPPPRSNPSYASPGYRAYSDADVRRLGLIKRAKLLSLSLGQLKQLVDAADDGCCETVEPQFHALLEAKLRETEEKLHELGELRDTLRSVLRTNGRSSKQAKGVSGCITDDCDSIVPAAKLVRKAAAQAAKATTPKSKPSGGVSSRVLPPGGCCEPDCGPEICP